MPAPTMLRAPNSNLSHKSGAEGGAPGFAGGDSGGSGLFFPGGRAEFVAGQAVPGLDADELGHAGLTPNEAVGEMLDVANHTTAGVFFVQTQGLGLEIHHAMAVVVKHAGGDRNGVQIAAQAVNLAVDQSLGGSAQAQGRFGRQRAFLPRR